MRRNAVLFLEVLVGLFLLAAVLSGEQPAGTIELDNAPPAVHTV
jgi:hypothetical protein